MKFNYWVRQVAVSSFVAFASLVVFHVSAAPPPGYYDSANGLSGTALKDALHNIIKNHTVLPYSSSQLDTADALKVLDEDPNNSNNVLLHYKNTSVSKASFGTTWNREHLWPQSKGADVSPKVSDLHHLFSENASLNSSRGNSIFNTVGSPTNSDAGNKWTGSQFEVRDGQKGDVARALLYMDVRYPEMELISTLSPGYNQMAVLSTLLNWHVIDPVSSEEELRNDKIYTLYQHNRNPFVDHPEYVSLIYTPASNGGTVAVSLNPIIPAGNIAAGSLDTPILSLMLTASGNEWDLDRLTIQQLGTVSGTDITAVKLYRDSDNSGTISAGDILLDSETFSGNLATLICSSPSRVLTSTPARFLVTASLNASATNGGTVQFRITANSILSNISGGTDTNPGNSDLDSNGLTVSGGVVSGDSLTYSFTNRAAASVIAGSNDNPLLSLNLSAATNEWDLASVAVTELGTIEDSKVVLLKLYTDTNNNGVVDGSDVLLDSKTLSSGAATFAPVSPLRLTTTEKNLLITANLAAATVTGRTIQLQVNSIISAATGGSDINPSITPFSSNAATVTGGVNDNDAVTPVFTSLAPVSVPAGAPNVPLASIQLTAGPNEWDLGSLQVAKLGTVPDATITAVKLYVDIDNNNAIDGTDELVQSQVFSSASATFQVDGAVRVVGTPVKLIVAVDLSPSIGNGLTVGLRLPAGGITTSSSGGSDQTPTVTQTDSGLAVVSNLGTVKIVMVSTRSSAGAVLDGGATSGNAEFIVLANQTNSPIDLEGWVLKKLNGGNSLELAGTIPARKHFLIASASYATAANVEGVAADLFQDNGSPSNKNLLGGLSDSGTAAVSIALFNGTEKVDGFGYGASPASSDTGSPTYRDGTQYSPIITGAAADTSAYRRKFDSGSDNYFDTNNNIDDFQVVTSKVPLNSASPISPPSGIDDWRLY